MILLEGVRKTFEEAARPRVVLEGVSLHVERGEITALVGRSGSGKSTLLNLLAGIDTPDSGQIEIAGLRLDQLNDRGRTLYRRRHVGFVFQFFNLLPTLTVEENVQLPLALGGGPGTRSARAWLDAVGLGDRAAAFPDRLSGGEQQRVAVARALITDPALILADEPTGNLDATTGAAVLALLVDLARGAGKTVIVVTHSDEVARAADRVVRLEGGRVAAGNP